MSVLWRAADLVAATSGRMAVAFEAQGVSIDTRSLVPGDLFVALVGENGDGHAHVARALAAGAAGAMVHRVPPGLEGAPLLVVGDTLEGLRGLGRFGRGRFGGRVVAVTGSVGKTTTKEMLRQILAAQGPTSAALASLNNHWGVPLTLARLDPAAAYAVVELGMNHAGEIAPLARMARPHVALITAIAPAHIGYLGSIEAIADEKLSIREGLEPGGVLVVPADMPMAERLCVPGALTFGREGAAAVLVAARADADGTDVEIATGGRVVATRLAAPGAHMAMNATGAVLAAVALGLDAAAAAALGVCPGGRARGAAGHRAGGWQGGAAGRELQRLAGGGARGARGAAVAEGGAAGGGAGRHAGVGGGGTVRACRACGGDRRGCGCGVHLRGLDAARV